MDGDLSDRTSNPRETAVASVEPSALIDDFGPLPLPLPRSVPELSDLVRQARGDGQAVYPLGGQTMLGYGLPPSRPGLAVDLRQLADVIDYPARDMTITVRAGITMARLQELLRAENQRLPIDVPLADRATLGGALATNSSGPRRHGFGTLRDYVIGISAVNDEGHEIKAGGRVVKNVAGYDLCKLFVGSLGTLGIITQVTLKLKPLPEEQALVSIGCDAAGMGPLLDQLHGSRTRPVCVELLNAAAARRLNRQGGPLPPETPWVVLVGYEDNSAAVAWQMKQLVREFPSGGGRGLDVHLGYTAEPLLRALVEFPAQAEAKLTFKANLLPSATAAFCQQAAALPDELLLQAHAGNGIVIGHAADTLTLDRAHEMLKVLQGWAVAAQGNIVVLRCPPAWKQTLPVWGAPRGDAWLMRAVKEQLDPRRLFNPGRFVDGI
jgi:glycolate oxidase FAD binding subunit